MATVIKIEVTPEKIIEAVKKLRKKDREDFFRRPSGFNLSRVP